MKDHSPSSSGGAASSSAASVCDGFMLPWLSCVQQYRNVYTLLTNKVFESEYIDVLESSITKWKSWKDFRKMDDLDWTEIEPFPPQFEEVLNRFHEENRDYKLSERYAHYQKQQPQKQSEEEEEVQLMQLAVRITQLTEKDPKDRVLEVAYARDALSGNLLGFEQFTKEKKEKATEGTLTLYIPKTTRTKHAIVLYKVYAKTPENDNESPQDMVAYKTLPIFFQQRSTTTIDA
eukprot:CAMPEP_0116847374 /NCGR_PEP_ID=MMETSP0418-20121206/14398_1 /TAXON_ID=1158023 /ORGANISM="Astrosyne radiata, Strain 13vi08-1A" /LENGTH=232 /DNA_ID=CAMNT_0004478811 /DNA_START=18 /DNA_END=716 /DNA_ORIENTATION=-